MMIEQLNKSRMYICMVFPQCELEYVLSYRICLSWFFRSRDKHAFQDQDKLDYSAKSKKIIARMIHKWKWSIFQSLFWVYSRNVESRKIILKNQSRISVFYKLFGVFQIWILCRSIRAVYICTFVRFFTSMYSNMSYHIVFVFHPMITKWATMLIFTPKTVYNWISPRTLVHLNIFSQGILG